MYVDSDKATGCLPKACTDEYLKGLVHEAWKNLQKYYVKTNILSTSKFIQDLHILKLKEEGDTTDLFEKIATIQIQARKIIDDTILEKYICSEIITAASWIIQVIFGFLIVPKRILVGSARPSSAVWARSPELSKLGIKWSK